MAISDEWHFRIKAVTRDLIKMVGGVVRAGEITGASKTVVSRWQSARDPEIIPVTAAAALEKDCGVPLVLAAYADLLGLAVGTPGSDDRAARKDVSEQHAATVSAMAGVMTAYASAAADDVITPAEADMVDREAGKLDAELKVLRRRLSSVKAGHRLSVVGED